MKSGVNAVKHHTLGKGYVYRQVPSCCNWLLDFFHPALNSWTHAVFGLIYSIIVTAKDGASSNGQHCQYGTPTSTQTSWT